MKDTIFLVFTRTSVARMTKRRPELSRGEWYTKLLFEAKDGVFREPVLETSIVIQDWREGFDVGDVELKEGTITETEAAMIRKAREKAMVEALAARGYTIAGPPLADDEEEG